MDIPETEKLDVNSPSALSPILPFRYPSLFFYLFLSLRMALAQRSIENHGGPLLPFSTGGREERKKNNLANFPSRTRALGQPLCETDVLTHFRVFSRLFALQSRIKGASTFIGLKPSSHVKLHGVWSTNSIPSWIIYDLQHSFPGRHKFNPVNWYLLYKIAKYAY